MQTDSVIEIAMQTLTDVSLICHVLLLLLQLQAAMYCLVCAEVYSQAVCDDDGAQCRSSLQGPSALYT